MSSAKRERKTPTLPKTRSVGHPEKLNQSLGVDTLERNHSMISVRQQKKRERIAHPPN
jgi:hypothetical protein